MFRDVCTLYCVYLLGPREDAGPFPGVEGTDEQSTRV